MSDANSAFRPMRSALAVTVAICLLCVTANGCAEKRIEHTVKKMPAEHALETPAKSQPERLAKSKEQVEKTLKARLDKLDVEIQVLKAKSGSLQSEARARFDKAAADLDAKREAAGKKLGELEKATKSAWEHLEEGVESAWADIEQAVKEAAKDF